MASDDEPRLFSVTHRAPVDVIAPQHQVVHFDLDAYGRWCREKYQPKTCESIEGRHDPGEGGRRPKPPQVSLPENDMHRRLDRVIRHMRMHMPDHGEALKLYYVGRPVTLKRGLATIYLRCEPKMICRILRLHWSAFGPLMDASRSGVLNLLRRLG